LFGDPFILFLASFYMATQGVSAREQPPQAQDRDRFLLASAGRSATIRGVSFARDGF
jgi:hypothetical protein